MTLTRQLTWNARENCKRREKYKRAITAKIFVGLRMYGNYKLPKHCNNNEVLKALCNEAGWKADGTTYCRGCKPPVERMNIVGGFAAKSPCSSYHPSPHSSCLPSLGSSPYPPNPNGDGNSLIPSLKNLSSGSSSASSSKPSQLHIQTGSINAPVTPPISSPSSQKSRIKAYWEEQFTHSSIPPSLGRQGAERDWFSKISIPQGGPTPISPTFNMVFANPFGFEEDVMGGRPSGTSSPDVVIGSENTSNIPMAEAVSNEFSFGSSSSGLVKPWKRKRIHEGFEKDDLELTLGNSKTRLLHR